MTEPLGGAKRKAVRVWLPEGSWVDFFTGRVAGGGEISRSTALADFPLYLRHGNAIAYNFRAPNVWSTPWRANDLSRPDRVGFLSAPRTGQRATARADETTFTANARASSVSIVVSRPRRETALRLVGSRKVCGATIGNKVLHRVRDAAGLRLRTRGWTSSNSETLVKLPGTPARQALKLTFCKQRQ